MFNMNWSRAATEVATPEPIRVTHYLHPTKGWKKGDGVRPLLQGCIPKAFKYSDGVIKVVAKKERTKFKKLIRKQIMEKSNAQHPTPPQQATH